MSGQNGNSSGTATSYPSSHHTGPERALTVVDDYKRSQVSKAEAILSIQRALSTGKTDFSTEDLVRALPTYLSLLDAIDSARQSDRSQERGESSGQRILPSPMNREESPAVFRARSRQSRTPCSRRRSSPSSSEEEEVRPKRARTAVDEDRFPWKSAGSFHRSQLEPDVQSSLDLLADWSNDPVRVQQSILLCPGCPDFPPDQWLNLIKGYAVDLAKVLGAHYSTDVETKQTQEVGDLFQISVKNPKHSRAIRTHGDWIIAFNKTARAIAFALPGRYAEYIGYQDHISELFAAIQPACHDRIIELDKAIRLRAANQKHLRLTDFAKFDDLRP